MGYIKADNDRSFRLLLLAAPIFIILVILGWIATRPPPIPDPDAKWSFGCYVSQTAPPILLDSFGLHALQSRKLELPFKLVRQKMGIVLSIKAPLNLARYRNGYRYYLADRKGGRLLRFYKVEGRHSYGIFDENDLFRFQIHAEDGSIVGYERAGGESCIR